MSKLYSVCAGIITQYELADDQLHCDCDCDCCHNQYYYTVKDDDAPSGVAYMDKSYPTSDGVCVRLTDSGGAYKEAERQIQVIVDKIKAENKKLELAKAGLVEFNRIKECK